jgi:polysaccharide pyruvyl transferase WcaK-like protein
MKKILIASGCEYSLNNKGDQAMLEGLVGWLKEVDPHSEITAYEMTPGALSPIKAVRPFPSPERFMLGIPGQHHGSKFQMLIARIRTIFRGIVFIARFFLYKLIGTRLQKESYLHGFFHQILSADVLFFSGGGYVNGLWWSDGLYSKTFPALVARLAGVSVILTSQGLGPFQHPLDRFVAWLLFSSCVVIGVRDGEFSKTTVKSISSQSIARVINTGDDALLVSAASKLEITSIFLTEGIPNTANELIVVNLRDSSSYQAGYEKPPFDIAAVVLDELLEHPGRHVVFVPISYHSEDGDRESASKIMKSMHHYDRASIISGQYSPSIIKGIIGQAHIAIGTSYHFLLFALSQNIPVLALYQDAYYKQKLEGLCAMYGQQQYCISLDGMDTKSLSKAAQTLLDQRHIIVDGLAENNRTLVTGFTAAHSVIRDLILNNRRL